MTKPTYRAACEWIAYNDSPADGPDLEAVQPLLTVALVADLFGRPTRDVALYVCRLRSRELATAPGPE